MPGLNQRPFRVAITWWGEAEERASAQQKLSRFSAIFAALERHGITAEPAVWSDALTDDVRTQLLGVDGVLVWVNPIPTPSGNGRGALDDLLREVAAAGVFVSAHPDVIDRMGVKDVLYRTRELSWGTDTYLCENHAAFKAEFPARVALGPRVLKQNRGNGGFGVWKVERAADADVTVQEAWGARRVRTIPLDLFMEERKVSFANAGTLVDQPFQARHLEGMIRCYISGDQVAGFGYQLVRALAPLDAGPASPRLYSGPENRRFQRLRALLEGKWISQMTRLLDLNPDALPMIWDADFLLGPKAPDGEDTYVLCEINASSVFPIPDKAPEILTGTMLRRLTERRVRLATASF